MRSEADIREALIRAHSEKRLITCRVPGGGDMCIALEKHMVDQALDAWRSEQLGDRSTAMASVRRTIKRTVKRMKQKRATGKEMDELAADIALWLGHELLFADGERHLVKGPSPEDFRKQLSS